MSSECYPVTVLPHVSTLYQAYLAMGQEGVEAARTMAEWYGPSLASGAFAGGWMGQPVAGGHDPKGLAEALLLKARAWGASAKQTDNIERLRGGARAVVTGQQVGLLGGPLLVLLKAATAIARAEEATRRTGIEHVPVFWLATEDHDLAEVDQVTLLTKAEPVTLRAGLRSEGAPVGGVALSEAIEPVLAQAEEMLGWAPLAELLRECYTPAATLGEAFGRWMTRVFADQGLVVMDASSRAFHALGASTLRYAIEQADQLEQAVIARSKALEAAGFHAQVKVAEEMSLLFLVSADGAGLEQRVALRRTPPDAAGERGWKAGRHSYTTAELLAILAAEPERLSPNALLRPVFQDTILPTAAYVGGPAEIAYWAQSGAVYELILGRVTAVLPRLSATLLEPAIATVMEKDEVALPEAMTTAAELALRMGARAMPIELKRRLAVVGNAMDAEVEALTAYVKAMDESLGRAAEVSGSKMRYQMNRLRRMMARHEAERETSLAKHAAAIVLNVFPDGKPQERVVAGAWYLSRYEGLIERLVEEAHAMCAGHVVVRL